MPYLSIIIPAYNEADRIGENLRQVAEYVRREGIDCEIIVVSDASSDDTAKIVEGYIANAPACPIRLLEQEANRGKGAAVKRGMLEADGQVRMFMDADLATPVAEIGNLLPRINNADVVIASRSVLSSRLERVQPFHRQFMGWVFRQLVSFAGVYGIRDSQCGFKIFSKRAAEAIFTHQQEKGFAFDVELLALAARFGFQVDEVGVTWQDSGRSSINPFIDPIFMFFCLLRIRWRCSFGDLRLTEDLINTKKLKKKEGPPPVGGANTE